MTDAERIRELSEVLRTLLAESFRGYTVGDRLQFSSAGRELLRRASAAMLSEPTASHGEPIMDSRCEYLHWPTGRCDKCGNVHNGLPPVVNFPSPA